MNSIDEYSDYLLEQNDAYTGGDTEQRKREA